MTFIHFLVWVSPTSATDALSANRPVLKSASEQSYPPFAIVNQDGSADGFSVELMREIADEMGFEISIPVGPWNEIKNRLIEGDIDVLPLVSYSIERDRVFDFTVPYLRMHGTIFVRSDEKSISSEDDLKGKEVLVMQGDTANEYAVEKNLSDNLITTQNYEQAFRLLSKGKHDAVVVQQLVGHQMLKDLGITNVVDVSHLSRDGIRPTNKPLTGFEQKFCIAVREGDHELLALLNEGLAIVMANGTYDRLYYKWFTPVLGEQPIPILTVIRYLLYFLLPSLFVLALGGIYFSRREIARQTCNLKEEIRERQVAEASLRESGRQLEISLGEKETLLRELYHRTKNNMQVIISMIDLQTVSISDEKVLKIFEGTKNKIGAMALVHEKLYQTKNLSRIDLSDYFLELIYLLQRSYPDKAERIHFKTNMDQISVTIDAAMPCGLIMSELISNALEHAFPANRNGEISICLKVEKDRQISFSVRDNGIGLPADMDIRGVDTMGLQSVVALAELQLRGAIDFSGRDGSTFIIWFEDKLN
jgi:two-component sensor histidine kinase/ABC-type amino acid transport substrate-binding protein